MPCAEFPTQPADFVAPAGGAFYSARAVERVIDGARIAVRARRTGEAVVPLPAGAVDRPLAAALPIVLLRAARRPTALVLQVLLWAAVLWGTGLVDGAGIAAWGLGAALVTALLRVQRRNLLVRPSLLSLRELTGWDTIPVLFGAGVGGCIAHWTAAVFATPGLHPAAAALIAWTAAVAGLTAVSLGAAAVRPADLARPDRLFAGAPLRRAADIALAAAVLTLPVPFAGFAADRVAEHWGAAIHLALGALGAAVYAECTLGIAIQFLTEWGALSPVEPPRAALARGAEAAAEPDDVARVLRGLLARTDLEMEAARRARLYFEAEGDAGALLPALPDLIAALVRIDEIGEAITWYEAGVAADRAFSVPPLVAQKVAAWYEKHRRWELAADVWRKVVVGAPDSPLVPNALFRLGVIALDHLQRPDVAMKAFRRVTDEHGDHKLAADARERVREIYDAGWVD